MTEDDDYEDETPEEEGFEEDEEEGEGEGDGEGEEEDEEGEEEEGEDEEGEDEEEEGEEEEDGEVEDDGTEEASAEEDAEAEVDLPEVEEDAYYSREQWPDAVEGDWIDDTGGWSAEDYAASANALFGWREDYGQTSHDQALAAGFVESEASAAAAQTLQERLGPGGSSVRMYEKDGALVPRGFLNLESLAAMAVLFPMLDLSGLHVTLPQRPRDAEAAGPQPRPLPPELQGVAPADAVDLRKYCTPVGDQGQTSRCAAFAWTHGLEMLANIQKRPLPPLSPSFTMLRFQQRQGDAKDFKWAWKGGDGTLGSWEPGKHLLETGTCRQELWPDDRPEPAAGLEALEADARAHTLDADAYDVSLDDMKRLLTAGLPVQLSIATGEAFQEIGPDGVMKVAEAPSGDHGYHAMLCVGYIGNYFIIKNSWGTDWGDQGYCYIPRKVLADAQPEPVAIVPRRPVPPPEGAAAAVASPARTAPVRCRWCGGMSAPAAKCANCGGPLRLEQTCPKCKAVLPPGGGLSCPACGTRHG